jgi:hypothetical protein
MQPVFKLSIALAQLMHLTAFFFASHLVVDAAGFNLHGLLDAGL